MTVSAMLRGAVFALAFSLAVPAWATGIIPLAGTQQFDKDTSPPAFLNGGLVDIYLAGTATPASIYSDFTLVTPLANPLTLNAAGRFPAVYVVDGAYRVRVRNSASVLQFDDDNVAAVTAAISTTPIVVTPQQLWSTGDVKVRFDDQPADGYVRCNGRTIGSATSGAAERANVDTQSLFTLLWSFANISVVTGKGASAAADWSANKQLTLPDCAGRLIGARDDLGAGAKSRITSATVTGPTLVGAVGGLEKITLDATMIPAHSHPSPAVTNPSPHSHFVANGDAGNFAQVTSGNQVAVSGQPGTTQNYILVGTSTAATVGLTSSASTNVSIDATTGSTGGGLASNNLSPVMLFTVYLKL